MSLRRTMAGLRRYFRVHWRGFHHYKLEGRTIVRYVGRRPIDAVEVADIVRWQVEWEMSFDIVWIHCRGDRVVRWLDYFNDLIEILEAEKPGG